MLHLKDIINLNVKNIFMRHGTKSTRNRKHRQAAAKPAACAKPPNAVNTIEKGKRKGRKEGQWKEGGRKEGEKGSEEGREVGSSNQF